MIVSDLLVDREPLFRGLEMLRHRRHDILVFHVLDDDELTFPFAGTTRFEGHGGAAQTCSATRARCATATWRRWRSTWSRCAAAARGIGIDYQLVRTSDYLDAVLSKFLHHRGCRSAETPVRQANASAANRCSDP